MKTVAALFLILQVVITTGAHATELHISMAASLREALSEVAGSYVVHHPNLTIRQNIGGSGTLAKQIESGAPADLFLSASGEWIDYLRGRGMISDSHISVLAYNELVFAGVPSTRAQGMQDLLRLERIAIGSPKAVPAGEYALEALRKAGIERQMQGRLVLARDVREALLYADRGEVEGAFVYRSDLLLARKAKTLFVVPRELYHRITYQAAVTAAGARKAAALDFYRFLQSGAARKILERHGFMIH